MRVAVLALIAGCGRIGFGNAAIGVGSNDDGASDGRTHLPATCPTVRSNLERAGHGLAVAGATSGSIVAWVDEANGNLAAIDSGDALGAIHSVAMPAAQKVVALHTVDSGYSVVVDNGTVEGLYFVPNDFSSVTQTGEGASGHTLLAFVHLTPPRMLWAHVEKSVPTRLTIESLDASGVPTVYAQHDAALAITDLSIEEAPGHAHIMWGQPDNSLEFGESYPANPNNFAASTFATNWVKPHGGTIIADDIIIGYETPAGGVSLYSATVTGTFNMPVSPAGHNIKSVSVDTSQYAVFVDTQSAAGVLTVAKMTSTGVVTTLALPDITPTDDDSYAIVGDSATTVRVVAIEQEDIAVVTPCL